MVLWNVNKKQGGKEYYSSHRCAWCFGVWIGSREGENAILVTTVHGILECGLEVGKERILLESLLCVVLWNVDWK